MEWEFGVIRCKLLHIEWINNKVLMHSTWNYIQHPLINHSGKEYEREDMNIYMCISISISIFIYICHFAVQNATF